MRALLRAVARALRLLPRLVMTPVYVAGALVGWAWSLIHPPADVAAQVAAEEAADAVQSQPAPTGLADRHLLAVQEACAAISLGATPSSATLARLPGRMREWLQELSREEAHALLKLPEDRLRQALRGADVGVLRCDRDYVDERRRERRRMIPDPVALSAYVPRAVRL